MILGVKLQFNIDMTKNKGKFFIATCEFYTFLINNRQIVLILREINCGDSLTPQFIFC